MSEHNPYPNENNTGHFWDDEQDIRELENRPPRWYMWSLYISAISVVIYAIYFPTIPWFGSHNEGIAKWTQVGEMNEAIQELEAKRTEKFAQQEADIASKTPAQILENKELTEYAVATAKTLFGENCGACHGSSGQGNAGFPVLVDDDWLYGGSIANIHTSITNGRKGNMIGYKAMLNDDEANLLTDFVISKGTDTKGKALYMAKGCVGCHMPNLKGMAVLGSANLSDAIYRFKAEDQKAKIKNIILYGVNQNNPHSQEAIMPKFGDSQVIDKNQLKKLAVFVHQLGGGK